MSDPAQVLRDFKPTSEFFIGIDFDGCSFDSREIKLKAGAIQSVMGARPSRSLPSASRRWLLRSES